MYAAVGREQRWWKIGTEAAVRAKHSEDRQQGGKAGHQMRDTAGRGQVLWRMGAIGCRHKGHHMAEEQVLGVPIPAGAGVHKNWG